MADMQDKRYVIDNDRITTLKIFIVRKGQKYLLFKLTKKEREYMDGRGQQGAGASSNCCVTFLANTYK